MTTQTRDLRTRTPWLLTSRDVCAGSWNEINADQQKTFSVIGYKVDTFVHWEDNGRTLVSTMTTTAATATC